MSTDLAVPPRIPDETLRSWWLAGAWHLLTPVVREIADATLRRRDVSPDDCDDLVASTILRAWTAEVVPLKPRLYVATMVRNAMRDDFKSPRLKRRDWHFIVSDVADHEPSALEAIVRAENIDRLRLALKALPDKLRRPLVLHDLHGQSCAVVAEKLAVSEGALKMRLQRARRSLGRIYLRTTPANLPTDGRLPVARMRLSRDHTTAPRPREAVRTPSTLPTTFLPAPAVGDARVALLGGAP